MPESLFGATLAGLGHVATDAGLPSYGARQICSWLYGKNASSFEDMLNLPRRAREWLAQRYTIDTPGHVKVTRIPGRDEKVPVSCGRRRVR